MKQPWLVGGLAVMAVGVLGAVWRASAQVSAAGGEAPPREVPRVEGAFIHYSPEFARRAGIETAAAEERVICPTLRATGTTAFDPALTAAVGARIAGRVRAVKRYEGADVKTGDVLAEVESAELGEAQAALLAARAHAAESAANAQREEALAEARVSSAREAEQARAAATVAKADLVGAEQKVRALGGEPGAEIGVLALRSPIAGRVVERHVSAGQSVDAAFTAFRVADLRRVWVDLAVFERDLALARPGDRVEISLQNGASVLRGDVAHVADVVDLDTRSADVRVVVDNEGGRLRPGQSVSARIAHVCDREGPQRPAVPVGSVVSVDGASTVFVSNGETSVEARTVVLGARDAAYAEVVSGIAAGEPVVVGGVFALKSELFR